MDDSHRACGQSPALPAMASTVAVPETKSKPTSGRWLRSKPSGSLHGCRTSRNHLTEGRLCLRKPALGLPAECRAQRRIHPRNELVDRGGVRVRQTGLCIDRTVLLVVRQRLGSCTRRSGDVGHLMGLAAGVVLALRTANTVPRRGNSRWRGARLTNPRSSCSSGSEMPYRRPEPCLKAPFGDRQAGCSTKSRATLRRPVARPPSATQRANTPH
jgi:hypothetical protein